MWKILSGKWLLIYIIWNLAVKFHITQKEKANIAFLSVWRHFNVLFLVIWVLMRVDGSQPFWDSFQWLGNLWKVIYGFSSIFAKKCGVRCKFSDEENGDGMPNISARPRRMSEISIKTTIRPLPVGSAFFIFSHTNR